MAGKIFIIGSRSSKLALAQSDFVRAQLKALYPELDIRIKAIKTTGDKISDSQLNKIGTKGLFTKEIEEALLAGEIDAAVHSAKDLPVDLPEGLKIASVPKRRECRDALVSPDKYTLKTLPANSKIGTSSLRRRAQALNLRKDLEVLNLRGNLDTRFAKLKAGLFDAIIVSMAGIERLGIKLNLSAIPLDEFLPQAGQGALAIQIRSRNSEAEGFVKRLNDDNSHICIEAERSALGALGGGCQAPIGVVAAMQNSGIFIKAGVFSLDGKKAVRDEISGKRTDAKELGRQLARRLLEKGAKEILESILR